MNAIFRAFSHDRTIAIAIFLIAIIIYSLLPIHYPFESSIRVDCMDYALRSENSDPVSYWFHPHHIYSCAFYALIWQTIGGSSQPIRTIHLLRWGAHISLGLMLTFFFLIARRMRASRLSAFLLCLILMLGYTTWTVGSFAEVVASSNAILFGIIWWLFYRKDERPPTLKSAIILGILFGLAITWHQVVIIYLPALLLAMIGWESKRCIKDALGFCLGAGFWSLGSYLLVFFILNRGENLSDFWQFITRYAQTGDWGKGGFQTIFFSLRILLSNQSIGFLTMPRISLDNIFLMIAMFFTLLLFMVGLWGWLVANMLQCKWSKHKGWAIVSIITGFIFINWWCPQENYFWLTIWAILLLGIAQLSVINRKGGQIALFLALSIISITNLTFIVLPRVSQQVYPPYQIKQTLSDVAPHYREHLLTCNWELASYLQYWGGVNEITILPLHNNFKLSSYDQKILGNEIEKALKGDVDYLLLDESLKLESEVIDGGKYYSEINTCPLIASAASENYVIRIYAIGF